MRKPSEKERFEMTKQELKEAITKVLKDNGYKKAVISKGQPGYRWNDYLESRLVLRLEWFAGEHPTYFSAYDAKRNARIEKETSENIRAIYKLLAKDFGAYLNCSQNRITVIDWMLEE
jgi:hypothetical protein